MRGRVRGAAGVCCAVVAALTALGGLAACTAGPSTRPEILVNDGPGAGASAPSSAQVPVPPLDEPADPRVSWSDCPENVRARLTDPPLPGDLAVRCARIESRWDSPYAPGAGLLRLQALRVGSGPVPVVVVNDADGTPGTIYTARLAATLPKDLLTRISLVGIDRRGTGNSDPATCLPPEVRANILGSDPTTTDVDGWLTMAQTAGQQCSIELASRLPALDTWHTAADLERVRRDLGMNRLHAIGHGEGSRVLTVFAHRYPDRVGRMVLDGVPDPTDDLTAALGGRVAGAEAALEAFAVDCVSRGCPLGADPKAAVAALIGQTRSNPLPGAGEVGVNAGIAVRAVLTGLADRAAWPALAEAVAQTRTGDGTALWTLIAPVLEGSRLQEPTFDPGLVIGCNDTATRLTPIQIGGAADEWRSLSPAFGAVFAQRLALCGVWTVPTQRMPAMTAPGSPPMVVLGTAADPVTPLSGSERAAQQLPGGTLVTWQGGGHGALGQSSCATTAAQAFLLDGTVPRNGTTCPP